MSSFSSDDSLVNRLRNLAGAGGSMPQWTPAGGRAVDGEVLHDSRDGAMEAVRSAATAVNRQIIVQAAGLTVVLDVTTADADDGRRGPATPTDDGAVAPRERLVVRGQIVSGGSGAAVVQFVAPNGDEGALAMVDEFGEFDLEVEAGSWLLVVADDLVDVSVPVELP
jgi:hypothetical protein